MNIYFKQFVITFSFLLVLIPTKIEAHAVQLGYCTSCNGDLRVWIEHWHTTEDPSTTSLDVTIVVNGVSTTYVGAPQASVQNTPAGSLPGCFNPINMFASCPADANTYDDWVAYDFPGVTCGVPITITVKNNANTTVFTQDCGGMYPATSGTFTIPCTTNQLPDVTACAGDPLGSFPFPAGNTWTNDNTLIGLPAAGAGDIPLFNTANNATSQTGNIVVTNSCGVETFAITVNPGPTSSFIPNVGCPGQPITFNENSTSLGGPITSWVWDFGDGSPIFNGQNPPPHTYPSPGGPYNVTLTTTANGCTNDTTITVDPLSGLVANFSAPSVCDGSPTLFSDLSTPIGNITSWNWDFDNDGTVDDNTQNPNFTFAGPGSYNVELMVIGVGGCRDSIVIPIVVNPIPVANFTGTNECLGATNTFTDLSTILTGNIASWLWDFGDATITTDTSSLQSPTYTYTTPGIYNVTLTITSDSGCTNIFNTDIQVFSIPVTNFTPNTACAGANSLFTDISILGSSGIQFWGWDFDNDAIADNTTQNPTYIFPAGVGAYPVNLNIVDSNGCVHDTTITVNVSAQPTANFSFTNECFGTATGFTDLSTPNGGTISNWDWDFQNDGTVDNINQNPTNGYPLAGTYTAELLVTTALGCKDSITMPIVVNPIPTSGFEVPTVCFGSTSIFTDTSSVITGNIVSWSWDFGDASGTSILQNPTYTYSAPGVYAVTLTVTSDSGCINTYIANAEVYFLPTAAFATNNVCLNLAADFIDGSNPNGGVISSWNWDFDGNGTTDDTLQNPSNLYITAGSYNVQLIVSTASGCADTIVQPIDIYPMPTADFAFVNACYGTAIAFTDNSAVTSGNIAGWNWDFGNTNTSIIQNPSENYLSEGVYNVELIATTDNACKDTISKTIEVWPIPVVNFTPTDVCLTTPTQFNDSTTVSNTNTANNIVQWSWDFGNGGNSTAQNPIYTYVNDGSYQAQLSVISNNGCTHDTTLTVTVNPLPQVSFGADTLSGCHPVVVNFGDSTLINAPGLLSSWSWDLGNGTTSNLQNPNGILFENLSNTTVATYGVSLTVTSDKGCIVKDSIANMISVYPIPIADFSFGPGYSDIYDREITFTDQSIIASVWNWDLGDGTTSTLTNPIHEYPDSGNYLVTLFMENQYGCKDTTDKLIRINPVYAIYIPNVFTPDGDGINDFFFSTGFGIVEKQMLIYDRWGVLFYEGYQMDSKWNGIYKGDFVQQDVYVYKIKVKDVFNVWHDYVGRVSLIK